VSGDVHGDRRPPDLHVAFGNDMTAPKQARLAVHSLLDDPDDPIAWDVTMATSELVTNVISHTALGGEMNVWNATPDEPFRIEVHDYDSTRPDPTARPSSGGRGLRIVESVSDAWGVTPTRTGKFVWAEFTRPSG
jgi:anti-sigma regulatory factor (Ser/Thr protein kinase)